MTVCGGSRGSSANTTAPISSFEGLRTWGFKEMRLNSVLRLSAPLTPVCSCDPFLCYPSRLPTHGLMLIPQLLGIPSPRAIGKIKGAILKVCSYRFLAYRYPHSESTVSVPGQLSTSFLALPRSPTEKCLNVKMSPVLLSLLPPMAQFLASGEREIACSLPLLSLGELFGPWCVSLDHGSGTQFSGVSSATVSTLAKEPAKPAAPAVPSVLC